jgi:hypothetical protein
MTDDSDPPADREAHLELRDSFRELARQRTAAKRIASRARRRHALIRAALTTFSAILLGGGIAAGLGVFTADHDGVIGADPKAPGHVQYLKPSERMPARSTAADPRGGPRWGLSTYTSENNRQCLVAARVLNGQMGVISNGTFTPLRKGVSGFCDKLSDSHLIFTVRRYSDANGGRTLLYGQVDREIQRLALTQSQRRREIRVFSDGTFLVVLVGENALRGARFTATIGGKLRSYQLG